MNDFNKVYVKQIEIIRGSCIEHVQIEVNKFLESLAEKEDYYPSEIKIHFQFASSEAASASYRQTHTMYAYTIEYMTQVKIIKADKIENPKGPTSFEGFKHNL